MSKSPGPSFPIPALMPLFLTRIFCLPLFTPWPLCPLLENYRIKSSRRARKDRRGLRVVCKTDYSFTVRDTISLLARGVNVLEMCQADKNVKKTSKTAYCFTRAKINFLRYRPHRSTNTPTATVTRIENVHFTTIGRSTIFKTYSTGMRMTMCSQ